MKLPVYDRAGKQVGDVEVSDAVFGRAWNPDLIHQIVVATAANRRQPLAHTKQRDEVSGGGRKPWRQKGTGRARHGSTRSPLWKGGGATFGPRNDRDYTQKINKKMVKAGVYVALSKKIADGEFRVIDTLAMKEARTRELRWVPKGTLLIPVTGNKDIFRASANIQKVKALDPRSLNVTDLLRFKNILIDREAVTGIK